MKDARHEGFTLVEMLVVIAILAMIAGFAGPQVMKYLSRSRVKGAAVQIQTLESAIDLYRLDVSTYPPDLDALVKQPPGAQGWDGPYLKKGIVPKDPWGHDYVYRQPGKHGAYDLMSLGADGREEGSGEDQDVVNWGSAQ